MLRTRDTHPTSHHSSGNTLAAAAAALHDRIQTSIRGGLQMTREEVYAALEEDGEKLSVHDAVALGGGGRILMPVGERKAQRDSLSAAASCDESGVDSSLRRPRTIQDICSDILIPPALA
jgi:hypothetical protein